MTWQRAARVLVVASLIAAAPPPIAAERVQEFEFRVAAVSPDASVLVRVAMVASDSAGHLEVFERRTPFTLRVPDGPLTLIAQDVDHTADIRLNMEALNASGVPTNRSVSGTGGTIIVTVEQNGHRIRAFR